MLSESVAVIFCTDCELNLQVIEEENKLLQELNCNGFSVNVYNYLLHNLRKQAREILDVARLNKFLIFVTRVVDNNFLFEVCETIFNKKIKFDRLNGFQEKIPQDFNLIHIEGDKYILHHQFIYFLNEEFQRNVIKHLIDHLMRLRNRPSYVKKLTISKSNQFRKDTLICYNDVYVDIEEKSDYYEFVLESSDFKRINEVQQQIIQRNRNNIIVEEIVCDRFYKEVYLCENPHIQAAVQCVKQCFERYGVENTFLSFNGGKDCTVLLHLTLSILSTQYQFNKPLLCLYVKHPLQFPEVDEFINDIAYFYGLKVVTVTAGLKDALKSILEENSTLKACLMGTRRMDPFSQDLQPFQMTDSDWPKIMRVSPLLDWNYGHIWEYLLNYKVPFCNLYNAGYTSLGNTDDTLKNPHLRLQDDDSYLPAYKLFDGSQERSGRS